MASRPVVGGGGRLSIPETSLVCSKYWKKINCQNKNKKHNTTSGTSKKQKSDAPRGRHCPPDCWLIRFRPWKQVMRTPLLVYNEASQLVKLAEWIFQSVFVIDHAPNDRLLLGLVGCQGQHHFQCQNHDNNNNDQHAGYRRNRSGNKKKKSMESNQLTVKITNILWLDLNWFSIGRSVPVFVQCRSWHQQHSSGTE